MAFFLLWILSPVVVGFIASKRGRNGLAWALLTMVLPVLLGMFTAAISGSIGGLFVPLVLWPPLAICYLLLPSNSKVNSEDPTPPK